MNGIPTIAISSENFTEILTELVHTPKGNIDKVDCEKLIATSREYLEGWAKIGT